MVKLKLLKIRIYISTCFRKFKHSKKFDAKRHLGKVKWNEDALSYQKRIRGEWD